MQMTPKPPQKSPFAIPPKAPLRGKGPEMPSPTEVVKPLDFTGLAKQRLGAAPEAKTNPPTRASIPMGGPAPAPASNGGQPRGFDTAKAPDRALSQQQYGYANSKFNDPAIREKALAKLKAKQADAGTQYPSDAVTNPEGTNPHPTAADAAGAKKAVDALHDQTTPIFGKAWDGKSGMWVDQSSDYALPAGVGENTPGVYFDPDMNEWVYDPEHGADMNAIDAQVEKALTSKPEDYGMSPELLAENESKIDRQGADAKAKLSQQLAGRGIGSSGLAGTGFGNIDVGTISAKTDLRTSNFQTGVEARINELKTLLTAHGNELSEKNRVEIAKQIADADKAKFEFEKLSQKESDQFTFLQESLASAGGKQWGLGAEAEVLKLLQSGMSYADVLTKLVVNPDGTMNLTDKYKQEKNSGEKKGGTGSSSSSGSTGKKEGAASDPDYSKPPPGFSGKLGDPEFEWFISENNGSPDLNSPPPGYEQDPNAKPKFGSSPWEKKSTAAKQAIWQQAYDEYIATLEG